MYISILYGYNTSYERCGEFFMNVFFSVLIIALIILLFPIPLKITLTYYGGKAHFRIYNKEINLKKKTKEKAEEVAAKQKDALEEATESEDLFNFKNIKKIVKTLKNNKFKFKLKSKISIDYSLEDAAHTAILFGLLNSLLSTIYIVLNMFFKVKNYDFKVTPQYNNNYFNFEIKSIISLNLAKIIYMCIIVFYTLKFKDKKNKSIKVQYKEEMQNG